MTTKQKTKQPVLRVRFVLDPDASFEECNGEGRPLTAEEYAENGYLRPGGEPIPYAEYLEYYGNPDRHVYLQCQVQKQCPCCGAWSYEGGTGGIDFMDDDPELNATDCWILPGEAEKLPGYLREVALQDLEEAGYTLPRSVYCQHKGCRAWHCGPNRHQPGVSVRYCTEHQPKVPA